MRGYMFRNRWFALLFVALTLAGVTTLVGTEKHDGAIQRASHQIAQQRARSEELTSGSQPAAAVASSTPDVITFSDEEELIDEAVGEDPTPADAGTPLDPEEIADEVVIVSREMPAPAGPQGPASGTPAQ